MSIDLIHDQILHNQVRVHTAKAGGSGTIIYSHPFEDVCHSYALTCHHVIADAIQIKDEWDSALGRQRKREYRQLVQVEFFDWSNVPHGHRPLTYSADAEIAAYDKDHDIAILKLRTIKQAPAVAHLLPVGEEKKLRIGSKVYACGCALLHDPVLTEGMITHMGDEIDYKDYWMSNAQVIFGNSGGSVFTPLDDKLYFVGIPSRLDIAGWGSPITHLGYFSPVLRIYKFFDEQMYHFLIPGHTHSEADCEREREERRQREETRLLLLGAEPAATKGPSPADFQSHLKEV